MPTLHWLGKEKVVNHHREVPFRVLEHQYSFRQQQGRSDMPVNNGNKIIHGDNLEALKALLPEFEGRVRCVYIDPPYNTGKEEWLYTDNVNHPRIQKWLEKVVGREGEDFARDDKWLCMMYPRLQLLHKLLSDDGVFFCSIDDNEQANVKLMLDEIFGAANFVNNIIWQRAFSPVNTKKRFSPNHDFIVCYAKNIERVEFSLPRSEDADNRYSNPDNDYRGDWTSSDLTVGPVIKEKLYPITTPSGKAFTPPAGRCWVVTEERFLELKEDNRIWFGAAGDSMPRQKRFKTEVKDGMTPLTVWTHKEVGHTQDAKKEIKEIFSDSALPFDTPKSLRLMERIIQLGTDKDSIVLDSFAGSGTTGHAVLNVNKDGGNRKFILIEMEDYSRSITAERLERVIDGHNGKAGIPGGFDYYELGAEVFVGDHQELINPSLPVAAIAKYIWYTETRSSFPERSAGNRDDYLLGVFNDTAYYFMYEPNRSSALDLDFIGSIRTRASQYVIYADNCLLPPSFMTKHNIIFKKIARDITRF